jgi:hypothetical protein
VTAKHDLAAHGRDPLRGVARAIVRRDNDLAQIVNRNLSLASPRASVVSPHL